MDVNMICNVIQTITGFLGLLSLFLLLFQIKIELRWKKLSFSIDKINISLLYKKVQFISKAGIDMEDNTMSDREYKKLITKKNNELLSDVCDILNILEDYAILYNIKALNKAFVYESYSETIIFYYSKFERIIYYLRNKYDPYYFNNLIICANELTLKKDIEQKIYNRNIKKFETKIKRKPRILKEKL